MEIPTKVLDPGVLQAVNAGVGALSVVMFFVSCFFAYPVVKKDHPDKGVIGLCKWMSSMAFATFVVAAAVFAFSSRAPGRAKVMVTISPEEITSEYQTTAFLRLGADGRLLQGTSRQQVEIQDRDQLDIVVTALQDKLREARAFAARQQQLQIPKAHQGGSSVID